MPRRPWLVWQDGSVPVLVPFAAPAVEWPHCDDDVGATRTGTSCAKSDEQHADREVSAATDDDGDADGAGSSAAAAAEEGPVMLPSFRWYRSVGVCCWSCSVQLRATQLITRVWLNFRGCAASRGFCSLSFSLG